MLSGTAEMIATPRHLAPTAADEALVERTLAGDLASFEQLVGRHRGVVYRVAARIAGPDEADDVTQDAFLRAFHRLSRFRGESPFRAWLFASPTTLRWTRSPAAATSRSRRRSSRTSPRTAARERLPWRSR